MEDVRDKRAYQQWANIGEYVRCQWIHFILNEVEQAMLLNTILCRQGESDGRFPSISEKLRREKVVVDLNEITDSEVFRKTVPAGDGEVERRKTSNKSPGVLTDYTGHVQIRMLNAVLHMSDQMTAQMVRIGIEISGIKSTLSQGSLLMESQKMRSNTALVIWKLY